MIGAYFGFRKGNVYGTGLLELRKLEKFQFPFNFESFNAYSEGHVQ
jgi:hypothetical protein